MLNIHGVIGKLILYHEVLSSQSSGFSDMYRDKSTDKRKWGWGTVTEKWYIHLVHCQKMCRTKRLLVHEDTTIE